MVLCFFFFFFGIRKICYKLSAPKLRETGQDGNGPVIVSIIFAAFLCIGIAFARFRV